MGDDPNRSGQLAPLDHRGVREQPPPARHRPHRPVPDAPARPGGRPGRDARRPHRPGAPGQGAVPGELDLPGVRQIVEAQWVAEKRNLQRFVCEQPPVLAAGAGRRDRGPAHLRAVQHGRHPVEPAGRRLAVGKVADRLGGPDQPSGPRGSPTGTTCRPPENQRKLEAADALGRSGRRGRDEPDPPGARLRDQPPGRDQRDHRPAHRRPPREPDRRRRRRVVATTSSTASTRSSHRARTSRGPTPGGPRPRSARRGAVAAPVTDPPAFLQTTPTRRPSTPLREWLATQNASAIVLLVATIAALVWANSPWSSTYEEFWTTRGRGPLRRPRASRWTCAHWINDGLMAFFFFVVGLEIRREFDMGELRERRRVWRRRSSPRSAASSCPRSSILAFNGGTPDAQGWGIAMGTDTAFALGVLALVGRRQPAAPAAFLLTLVIVDDIAALLVIAVRLHRRRLLHRAGRRGRALLVRHRRCCARCIRNGIAYFVVASAIWVAMLESGIHPTIAGVAVGLLATVPTRRPATPRARRSSAGARFREQPTPEYARSASRACAARCRRTSGSSDLANRGRAT